MKQEWGLFQESDKFVFFSRLPNENIVELVKFWLKKVEKNETMTKESEILKQFLQRFLT